MLQSFGPIIVIDDEDPSAGFALHARIINGIEGDEDGTDTQIKIIDPDGGKSYDESFKDFTGKYESLADVNTVNIQIMHY